MSEAAKVALRELWSNLQFFTVDRTVASEPEDVDYIELREYIGTYASGEPKFSAYGGSRTAYTRLREVPKKERWRARILWERFHGFTTNGLRFDSADYNALNWSFSIGEVLEFGIDAVATSIRHLPEADQLVCGVIDDADPSRLAKWFVCDEAFRLLVTAVREGTQYTEEELGRLLLTDGFPDTYWALARLVLFDNAHAFVNCIKTGRAAPSVGQLFMGNLATVSSMPADFGKHPAQGQRYGASELVVDWRGMYIEGGFATFVHVMSHVLNEPQWWTDFLKLTSSQGVMHSHPSLGGVCVACMAGNPNWHQDYCGDHNATNWPYQIGPNSS